jgi:hypothetical protein
MKPYERHNGHSPPVWRDADRPGSSSSDDNADTFDATEAVLRLLVGGLLEGTDELRTRLQRWDRPANNTHPLSLLQSLMEPAQPVSASESVRHALVGMLFETEAQVRKRFSAAASRLADMSDRAEYIFTTRLEPTIRRTPLRHVLARLDDLQFQIMVARDRWTERGQREEEQGRMVARQTLEGITHELIDYMSRNPEVRQLIERQGTSIAEEAVDEVRDRTAAADSRIEQIAHSLLRRPDKGAGKGSDGDATRDESTAQPSTAGG